MDLNLKQKLYQFLTLYHPNREINCEIFQAKDTCFLIIIDPQCPLSSLELPISTYIDTFTPHHSTSLVIYNPEQVALEDYLIDLIEQQDKAEDELPDIVLLNESLNEMALFKRVRAYIHIAEHLEDFVYKLAAANRPTLLLQELKQIKHLACGLTCSNDPESFKTHLQAIHNNTLNIDSRHCLTQLLPIHPLEPVYRETVKQEFIGLGLQQLNLNSDPYYHSLESHILKESTAKNFQLGIVGHAGNADSFVARFEQSPMGHVLVAHYDSQMVQNFAISNLFNLIVFKPHITHIILVTVFENYRYFLQELRKLSPYLHPELKIICPFLQQGSWSLNTYEDSKPILILSSPKAGSMRLIPVIGALLSYLDRKIFEIKDFQNHERFLSRATSGMTEPLSSQDIQAFFQSQISLMNTYDFAELHRYLPIQSFAEYHDLQIIVLMRDPRDIIVSYYHFLVYGQQGAKLPDQFHPDAFKEERFLQILEGHSDLNFGDIYTDWPGLEVIMDYFLTALHSPNMYVIRFEELHQDPLQAYWKLLKWLKLARDPLKPLNDEILNQFIYLGTFEHQSKGQLKRGQNNLSSLKTNACRKGIMGDWKNHFTPAITKCFKELAGQHLIQLDYEQNMDW